MHLIVGSLVVGGVAGAGIRKLAWRSVLKEVIKQGIRAQRSVMELSTEIRAETNRLVTDARAELDQKPSQTSAEAAQ